MLGFTYLAALSIFKEPRAATLASQPGCSLGWAASSGRLQLSLGRICSEVHVGGRGMDSAAFGGFSLHGPLVSRGRVCHRRGRRWHYTVPPHVAPSGRFAFPAHLITHIITRTDTLLALFYPFPWLSHEDLHAQEGDAFLPAVAQQGWQQGSAVWHGCKVSCGL